MPYFFNTVNLSIFPFNAVRGYFMLEFWIFESSKYAENVDRWMLTWVHIDLLFVEYRPSLKGL